VATVFLGTSEFAAAVLARLAGERRHRPALVITRPDRPQGRGRRLGSPPVAERARELGLPLEQPERVNDESTLALIARAGAGAGEPTGADRVGSERVTVIVCAFGALIREPLLSAHELLNVHPSLLPRWRGAAPIERAIMAGDADTGVSIMRLEAGLDSGPVCLAKAEPIRPEDTYGTLAARLQELAGELLVRALEERPPFVEQSAEGVSYAEKITPEDRLLDVGRPAVELERIVRALDPHIGARLALDDGTLLGVRRAAAVERGPAGGGLQACDGRLLLSCAVGALELLVVQPPGGKAMDAAAYLRGHRPDGRA
jgi:methionyl-tRNA formyltransferase